VHRFLTSYHHHPAFLPRSSLYPFPLFIPCCNPPFPKIPLFASHKMGGRSESPPPLFSPRPPRFSWANDDNAEFFGRSTPPLAHPFTQCEVCFESHSSQCEECCTSLGCCLCLALPSGTFAVLEQAFYTRLGVSASPLRQRPISLAPAYPFEPTAPTLGSTYPDCYTYTPSYQMDYSTGSQFSDPKLLAPCQLVSTRMERYYSHGNRGADPLRPSLAGQRVLGTCSLPLSGAEHTLSLFREGTSGEGQTSRAAAAPAPVVDLRSILMLGEPRNPAGYSAEAKQVGHHLTRPASVRVAFDSSCFHSVSLTQVT
jgi:hypothetical protein